MLSITSSDGSFAGAKIVKNVIRSKSSIFPFSLVLKKRSLGLSELDISLL